MQHHDYFTVIVIGWGAIVTFAASFRSTYSTSHVDALDLLRANRVRFGVDGMDPVIVRSDYWDQMADTIAITREMSR